MKYNSIKDPIRIYNEILGGKWRLLILYQLFSHTQRFKDLTANIEGITPRMLTKELRMLEKYNLIEKEIFKEVPPRVEYSLTDDGVKLFPLIENIKQFGENFAYLLLDESEFPRPEKTEEIIILENKEIVQEPPQVYTNQSIIEKIEEPIFKTIAEKTETIEQVEKVKVEDEKKVVQLELF